MPISRFQRNTNIKSSKFVKTRRIWYFIYEKTVLIHTVKKNFKKKFKKKIINTVVNLSIKENISIRPVAKVAVIKDYPDKHGDIRHRIYNTNKIGWKMWTIFSILGKIK